jgi:hypothetical protein
VFVSGHGGGTMVPFFIEWDDDYHPAEDAPPGLVLASFSIETPDPARLRSIFSALDVKASVRKARRDRLRAVLETPQGRVVLTWPLIWFHVPLGSGFLVAERAEPADGFRRASQVEGFVQILGRAEEPHALVVAIGAHDDDRNRSQRRPHAERVHEPPSVHPRHHQVEEDDAGWSDVRQERERLAPVAGALRVPPLQGEVSDHRRTLIGIVLDDHDSVRVTRA